MTADNNIGGIGLSDEIGRDLTRSDEIGIDRTRSD